MRLEAEGRIGWKKIANTGALCCVAAGPHGVKSPTSGRDFSLDNDEPRWQTNSSFSPPPLRIWDCRLHSDGLQHGAPTHGSSISSNSRGGRSRVGSERYSNHQHSVSDGVLSYSASPPDNIQEPRWTSPLPKFNLAEHAGSSLGGSRSQTSWFPRSCERRWAGRAAAAASPSFGSSSSLSELGPWESSTSKQPFSFSNRNFPGRRSYMSKPVYPLVFRNPVSDTDTLGDTDINSVDHLTPGYGRFSSSSSVVDQKFHKFLTELQRLEASPEDVEERSASSRREGFRWSSASSYDLGFDGDRFDITDHMDVESLMMSPVGQITDQKCGICEKFLWQKSPWSSGRIMRGSDMPIAGILSCSHVFHAECLEQVTPKTQIPDPPCPTCSKTLRAVDELSSVSEPLQMTLRSVQRSIGVYDSESQELHSDNRNLNQMERLRRNWSRVVPRLSDDGLSFKKRFKKHFSFKGKTSKDTKVLQKMAVPSSSSIEPPRHRLFIK